MAKERAGAPTGRPLLAPAAGRPGAASRVNSQPGATSVLAPYYGLPLRAMGGFGRFSGRRHVGGSRSFPCGAPQSRSPTASGYHVLADGVETTAQLETLRALGCERGQGYLFSRPVSARATETVLKSWDRQAAGPTRPDTRIAAESARPCTRGLSFRVTVAPYRRRRDCVFPPNHRGNRHASLGAAARVTKARSLAREAAPNSVALNLRADV